MRAIFRRKMGNNLAMYNCGHLSTIMQAFSSKKILVVGDLIADEYIFTHCHRISREAPVLILKYENRQIILGGAANATHNIKTLGAEVFPLGMVGRDDTGSRLLDLMLEKKISTELIYVHDTVPTVTKTRVLAGSYHTTKQQVIRIDREPDAPFEMEVEQHILRSLTEYGHSMDAILISDYGLGVCTPKVISRINQLAEEKKIIITVDSRYASLAYQGVTALTPNETEVEQALRREIHNDEDVKLCGQLALQQTGCQGVLITRGKKGMYILLSGGEHEFIPIYGEDEVADVTGAGDTVISTFTLALTAGASMMEAAKLANYAGGIVVMKSGTAPVYWNELHETVQKAEGHHD